MPGNGTTEALRARCLERRVAAVRDAMRGTALDCLVAYGSGRHSFLASNPAWYLTGFRQLGPHMAVILTHEGQPTVIVTPRWDHKRCSERVVGSEIVAVEPEDFLLALRQEINRGGLAEKRIAVAGGVQPRAISDAWASLLRWPIADGDQIVGEISKIRDEWSLACTRQAARIAEQGHRRMLEVAREGMAEYQLAAEIEAHMRLLGAEDNFQLLSASQHNRAAHRPSNRVLAAGDVILAEITPAVEGEYLQICRTAVLGKSTQQQRVVFALLDTALRDAIREAKPGVPARRIVEIMNKPIVEAGYGTYCKPPYMRTRGHSMALGSMDPEIAPNSPHVLAEGSVFILHPNQYVPETGYMMCGEPVLMTESGAQPLTSVMGTLDEIAV